MGKSTKRKAEFFDADTAEATLSNCIKTNKDPGGKANCATNLGVIYSEGLLGKVSYRKALPNYKIAYDLEPENLKYIHNLGLAYYNTQSYHKALPLLKICAYTDSKELTDYNKVTCVSKLGVMYSQGVLGEVNYFKAFESYKLANALEPENEVFRENLVSCSVNLGQIYGTLKPSLVVDYAKLSKAIEYYGIAHSLKPNEALYSKSLADVYFQMGQLKQAQILLEECLKAQLSESFAIADKADAANSLGYIYQKNELQDIALRSFSLAHQLAPNNSVFTHNLAMSCLHAQQPQNALNYFTQCSTSDLTENFLEAMRIKCIQGIKIAGEAIIDANLEL